MKSKLLPLSLAALILLNVVLIFILIKKPHQNKEHHPERDFLTEQLQFSEGQKEKFLLLDEIHKEKMMNITHKIRAQKDILFNSFSDENINIDSLANITGSLEAQKELEVFHFFKKVREICSNEQQEKFDKIIKKALKGGGARPPRNNGNPPPREGGMPPPPR